MNNAGDCPQYEEVCNRLRSDGVQAGGSSKRDIFPQSGGQDKFIAEGLGNWPAGFKEGFKMRFGSLLKTQSCLTAITSVGMATGQR